MFRPDVDGRDKPGHDWKGLLVQPGISDSPSTIAPARPIERASA